MKNQLDAIQLSCIRHPQTLFANLSFSLNVSEVLLVEGENGCGKSSLLRLLVGLMTPHEGEVCWQEVPIQEARENYTQHLHYVGHRNGVKTGLTIVENIEWMKRLSSSFPTVSRNSDYFLEAFGLAKCKHTPANQLSAGQQRKLALLKLFLFPKLLWILDEPLTALDTTSQTLFVSLLEQHLQEGGMCIMSSHHPVPFHQIKPITLRLG